MDILGFPINVIFVMEDRLMWNFLASEIKYHFMNLRLHSYGCIILRGHWKNNWNLKRQWPRKHAYKQGRTEQP